LSEDKPLRQIGVFSASSLVVSNMVGAGIFTASGFMITNLRSPLLLLAIWLLGGLLSLAGAALYGELGASMPRVGGDYVYLRQAYGRFWAFLDGWVTFFAGMSGPIALTAIGFVQYLTPFFPWLSTQGHKPLLNVLGLTVNFSIGHLVAIAAIWLLTLIHYLGINVSGRIQSAITLLNLGLIIGFVALAFGAGTGSWENLKVSGAFSFPLTVDSLPSVAVALVMVMYAYSGFNAGAYVGGEIRNPGRNLPLALLLGTGLVVLLYFLLNLVYVYALPPELMSGRIEVANAAAERLFGPSRAKFFSIVIAFCVLACSSAMACISPRMYYVMAKDKFFFPFAGKLSPRFRTPGNALVLQGIWASTLVVMGTFSQLLTYCGFMLSLLATLTVSSVFILRRRHPEMPRPYKTWGYPYTPIFYVGVSVWMMVYVLATQPGESLIGLGIAAAGIPVYMFWNRREKAARAGSQDGEETTRKK
jgi:basic amino acid/polyamine antiporter, APA family